jgi:hypothetical protein
MKAFNGNAGRISDLRYIISTFTIDYFLRPVLSGISGFASFFAIIIVVKLVLNYIDKSVAVNPVSFDLQISAIGFILAYGLKVIKNLG